MASISTRGFTALYIYLTVLLLLINAFALATPAPGKPTSTPTPHAPCDDVPCIAGCLSDSRATQPASCSKNDPAKAIKCLCATVASVAPKRVFAECVMECGVKERETLKGMCGHGLKHHDDYKEDEGENKKNKEHAVGPKKNFSGASLTNTASNSNDADDEETVDDATVDEEGDDNNVDESVDDTTVDEEDDKDDDDHPEKTLDVVTNINMDEDEDLDDDDNVVVINGGGKNRKGDASSMVASMKWATIGAMGVAVLAML